MEVNSSSQSQPVDGGATATAVVVGNGGGEEAVKRKRGRPPLKKQQPVAKKSKEVVDDDEDVCFICFDGGSLVLCDRRGCPKAYHPACIKRDEAFFRSKAKWTC
ncbi:zinc finger CCCH domain-containing protein 44-like protein, partial [Tanacetum coccineum]